MVVSETVDENKRFNAFLMLKFIFFRHATIQLNNHYSPAPYNRSYAHSYIMKHLLTDNGLTKNV